MADVEAMYHQVCIPEKDRNALRFLWMDGDVIRGYRMRSHLFGGVWCASSSTFALRRTTEDFPCSDLVQHAVSHCMYVDDLLMSLPTMEDATEVLFGCKRVLSSGGFNLTKFVVNDQDLLQTIPIGDRATEVKEISADLYSKALGIKWDIGSDAFRYTSGSLEFSVNVTKRLMLSQLARLYDPLGLISVIVQQGKVMFQQATRLKLSWDAPIPLELASKWSDWIDSLKHLSELHFPRCVCPREFVGGVAEIHNFCDACESGYGACSYIRIINQDGKVHVALLAGKSRLAPLKQLTMPRLELCAAVLAVKLDHVIKQELELQVVGSSFWSDSMIVLAYIKSESRRFKVFVANRVSTIRQHSQPEQWRHVRTNENPADILSRGCKAQAVSSFWMRGPNFLSEYKGDWQVEPVDRSLLDNDTEVKKDVPTVPVDVSTAEISRHPVESLLSHYSSFYRLKKALVWLLRLREFLRSHRDKTKLVGHVSVCELARAEEHVLRHAQSKEYESDLKLLKDKGFVPASSSLRKLNPVIDSRGVLVVGGRLKHARVSDQSRHPVILPAKSRVSRLIVEEIHGATHLGTEWTLCQLRGKYWIIKARNLIKRVKHSCVTCRILYAPTHHQKMADLPVERVEAGHPCFTYTGVDIFGPFYVKTGRSESKRYGCIFTCLTTRAVHIEVLNSLETDTFISGFMRFIARRGCPKKVFSDNGTNLVGAYSELSKSLRQLNRDQVVQSARKRDIEWRFNPPLASHQGGVWERMIRTIRRVLCALLDRNARLTDDVLNTVMCEAESIVNSRPITKLSDDVEDDAVLTPNHLLLLHGNMPLPWGVFSSSDLYRKRWRQSQILTNQFWRRWIQEYLPQLQSRTKWHEEVQNLKVGDLVLLKGENSPRGSWPLGRVVAVKYSKDNLVRSATIKTQTSEFDRPVTKLVLLEGVDGT